MPPVSSPIGEQTNEKLSNQPDLADRQAELRAETARRLASGNQWADNGWRPKPHPLPHKGEPTNGGL
jgi:hypothetical protein